MSNSRAVRARLKVTAISGASGEGEPLVFELSPLDLAYMEAAAARGKLKLDPGTLDAFVELLDEEDAVIRTIALKGLYPFALEDGSLDDSSDTAFNVTFKYKWAEYVPFNGVPETTHE